MGSDYDWTGRWIAGKIQKLGAVASVTLAASNILTITRKRNPAFKVATLSETAVTDESIKKAIGTQQDVAFVVNAPKNSYLTGDALKYAAQCGFAVGGLGDLMRALSMTDVTEYVPPTIKFIDRGLRQHDCVQDFERLADLSYLVRRRKALGDLRVVFLHEYELTADHVRVARDRYGNFKMVVITNPNGNATASAHTVAEELGCRIYKWGEFLGALNRP